MSIIRAMRLLNSVEAGTTTGSQLENILTSNESQFGEFNILCNMKGQATRMASSPTTMTALCTSQKALDALFNKSTAYISIASSVTALSAVMNSSVANTAAINSSVAANAILSNRLAYSIAANAAPVSSHQAWVSRWPWTQRTLPASTNWSSVTYGNGVFVAVATGTSNVAATSPDGVTWTQRTLPAGTYWSSVTYGNGIFVAVAGSGANTAATNV